MVLQKARFQECLNMSCNVHPCGVLVAMSYGTFPASPLSTHHLRNSLKLTGNGKILYPKKNWVVKTPTDQVRTLPKDPAK